MRFVPQLDIGRRTINYDLLKGTSRRYTYLRFRSDLTLEVVLPRGRRIDLEALFRERLRWIAREYELLQSTRSVLTADSVMYGGSYLRIALTAEGTEGVEAKPESGELLVRTNESRRVRELIRRWFLKETSSYVVRRVSDLAPFVGVRPSRVDVREINKWGYCTRNGRLSFSWQLIALPERLREYVVLHELTHLVEFNHSPAFRRALASKCPDFRQRERELDRILPYDRVAVG